MFHSSRSIPYFGERPKNAVLYQFCTSPNEFCVFGIDPTLNVFEKNISVTVTTDRNLRLVNKSTNKPPVFIGPLLMHQHKAWKTYSKFAHTLKEKWEERGKTSASTGGSQFTIGFENRRYKIQFFSPTKFPNPLRTCVKYVSFIWNMQSTTHGIKLISQAFLLIFVPRAQGRNLYPYS